MRRLREELGVNTTCGASNISFGLPNRHGINNAFLAMASAAGMTSAIMNPVTLVPSKKTITDRLDELRAAGLTIPDDVNTQDVAALVGLGTTEDLVDERLARLAALGIVPAGDIDHKKLGPLLGIGGKYGQTSEEIVSIKAADFLVNQDPSGGNWIKLNKPGGSAAGGRGGRGERRRRRAG